MRLKRRGACERQIRETLEESRKLGAAFKDWIEEQGKRSIIGIFQQNECYRNVSTKKQC